MPKTENGKTKLTEEEAKKIMEDMNQSDKSKDEVQNQINQNLKGKSSYNSNTSQSAQNSGQGKGWWNDPIKHALASQGIQTAMSGDRSPYDDMGSVYLPSDRLKGSLKEKLDELESDNLKEILKETILENPQGANELDERVEMWIENNIGSIQHKSKSQEERNQTINGNIQLTEEEYEVLEDFNRGLNEDSKSIEMWVQNINSKLEKEKNEAKNELQEFVQEQRQKAKNPQDFRMKVQQKIDEKTVELNQVRADLKYAEQIQSVVDEKKDEVQSLYQKSIKNEEV